MTDLQKSKITDLRSRGMSYAEIAENLGLSRDTVKSFCRRNNLAAETHKQQITNSDDLCRECGKHLTQTEGKKRRVFCCKECREKWWHSLSTQVSYYSSLIQSNPQWEFAGIFADFGISGTGVKNRDEFNKMLKACEEGEIQLILTKSISRFARNTVDLLATVRHLKELGVEVRFEKENISTFSNDG